MYKKILDSKIFWLYIPVLAIIAIFYFLLRVSIIPPLYNEIVSALWRMQENFFDKLIFILAALIIIAGIITHLIEGINIYKIMNAEIEKPMQRRLKIFLIWSLIFTLIGGWLLISLYFYMKPF